MEGFSTCFKPSRHYQRLIVTGIGVTMAFNAAAMPIDFESQGASIPGTFGQNSSDTSSLVMLVNGITVTFSGGILLSRATDLPANETSVYGTTSYVGAMDNPLRITFSAPVDNLVFSLYNGQTANTQYEATENGISQQFALAPNIFKGSTQISFGGTSSEVDISDISGRGTWDFFIDNLQFDPVATPINVPDAGSTVWLLALGVAAMGLVRLSFGNFARRSERARESFAH